MPEGQVSHRNALRFSAALGGREVLDVYATARLKPQRIEERLVGDHITEVTAVGKHHLFQFRSGRVLHSHLMMNGTWRLLDSGEPLQRRGLWLGLVTDLWVAAQYRGPVICLYEPGERIANVAGVGPDLLGDAVDPEAATLAALRRCPAERQVGDALMDQRLVSGIGNVYKSETCFLAGIDPWRPVGSLTDDEAATLGRIAAELLELGVRQRGRIRTYRPPGGRPFSREDKWVYGRNGKPCRRCGTPIDFRGQGDTNRTTYWCPQCQN